jgi:AcrR family transcriptional regulator
MFWLGGRVALMANKEVVEGVPEPPWKKARAEPPGRTPLTRDAIVDAALEVLAEAGPEGLSMRRVAERLGTGAASLYWHVASKDELIELMIDRVISEIRLPEEPDPARWQEQLTEWMVQAREVLRSRPGVGALTLGRIPVGPNVVRWIEWLLALLRGAGVPDRIAAYAGDLGGLYLGAHALEDSIEPRSSTGEAVPPEEMAMMIRGYFESLPADRFPNVHETIDDLVAGGPDERFVLGLEIMTRGIASYIEDTHRKSKR